MRKTLVEVAFKNTAASSIHEWKNYLLATNWAEQQSAALNAFMKYHLDSVLDYIQS